MTHWFKRVRERVRMMFGTASGKPDGDSSPLDASAADISAPHAGETVPPNYIRSYDEGRPRK